MPDENKIGVNSDLVPILPDENDDITEYLTDSSFESLKKRFAAAEEDQSIRDEDFNPLIAGKATKKAVEDGQEFGSADSEFDNDAISFGEIDIDLDSFESLIGNGERKDIDRSEEYNTNTRVIFVDEDTDDGIKRNTDTEVTDVFFPD